MSRQTKTTIAVLILSCVFGLAISKPNNLNWVFPLAVMVLAIGVIVAADRFPRVKAFIQQAYSWFLIAVIPLGTFLIFIGFLRGNLDFGSFILVFVPAALLIGLVFTVFYLGSILIKMGKITAAEDLYTFMIRVNHNFGYAYVQRGTLRQVQKKEMTKALLDYDSALDIAKAKAARPKQAFSVNYHSSVIYSNKAVIYLMQRNAPQAIIECNNGLALNGQPPIVHLFLLQNRAYAYVMNANYDAALIDLDTIHFDGPMACYKKLLGADVAALKALAYWELNRHDEAKIAWLEAVAAQPNYNQPEWLRETRKWPHTMIELAAVIQHDLNEMSTKHFE